MSILSKSEDFKYFSLNITERNEYAYLNDLNILIDNFELILTYFEKYKFENDSIDSFIDLLFLKKISSYKNLELTLDEFIDSKLNELLSITYSKINNDFNKLVINFINLHFIEIFSIDIYQLEESIPNLIFKFQNGIHKDVFKFLISENKFLLFNNYEQISKKFDNDIELLEELFSDRNILEFCQVRLKVVINIYQHINRKKTLKNMSEKIINGIISYGYLIKDNKESRELIHISIEIDNICKFLNFEQHIEANNFNIFSEELKNKLDEQLMENGKVFSQEIPVGKIVDKLTKKINYPFTLLSITHEINGAERTLKNQLEFPSEGEKSFLDKITSSEDSDDFFTHSHKNILNLKLSVPVATLHYLLLNTDNYFDEFINLYDSMVSEINSKVVSSEIIKCDDFETLFQMIYNLKNDVENEVIIQQIHSYTLCMFLCSLIEKTLRNYYFYLVKESKFVPINKITLSDLIDNKKNPEMSLAFGENHLKHLKYFLLTEGEKKIGFDYRNRLAHWRDIEWEEIDTFLAIRLFYIFTDVLNTIYIDLVLNPYLEGT